MLKTSSKAFREGSRRHSAFQEKLCVSADPDAVALIANEAGFGYFYDDPIKARFEIEDKELEAVASAALRVKATFASCPYI